jgi:hypothetical protein
VTQSLSVTAREEDAQIDPNAGSNFTDQSSSGDRVTRVALDSEKQQQSDEKQSTGTTEKLIFGKYKTMDEAEKAFKGLESQIGQRKTEAPKDETKATTDLSKVDLTELKDEFVKTGKLSDAAYQKAAAKGISKADLDQYLAVQKANTEKYVEDLSKAVGGREQLDKLIAWANANLTQKQAKTVDAALQSGDLDQASLALEGLNARYVAATGKDPELVGGESKGSRSGVQPFGDTDEMVRAMSDPRYRTSPAYQKEVEQRIAAMDGGMSVRVV